MSTIFHVVPLDKLPNQRSGIIFGQNGFIEKMVTECIPRAIMQRRGEEVEETCWGMINVKAYLDLQDDLQEFKMPDPSWESAKQVAHDLTN